MSDNFVNATTPSPDVTVEFTYFAPGRGDYSQAMQKTFGSPYTWPLQSMPHSIVKGLSEAYGLIYWPGETIDIHLRGTDAGTVDRIAVTSLLNGPELTITGTGLDRKLVVPDDLPPAPYLALYRVHCFSGGKEVASRGLVVTRPWAGAFRTDGNPAFPQSNIPFGEWRNGSNPFGIMVQWEPEFWFGPEDHWFPWRDRPYQDTDRPLLEIYFPRHHYHSANIQSMDDRPNENTDSYLDPSYEWNYLWCYSGRGLGRWDGNWTWGPFDQVSASWIQNRATTSADHTKDIDICYADMRRVSGAFPNGMLFWQWAYGGTKRMALRAMNYGGDAKSAPEMQFGAYDGWAADRITSSWTDGPGMISLYYRRCLENSRDTSWADGAISFRAFMLAQRQIEKTTDPNNDFAAGFADLDLARRNFYSLQLAAHDAYKQTLNKTTVDYHSGLIGTPVWEGTVLNELTPDQRPHRAAWNNLFNNGFGAGAFDGSGSGDTSHLFYLSNGVDPAESHTRYYRWRGYQGAAMCALWPECYYGGCNGDRLNGYAPQTPRIGGDISGSFYDLIDALRDDGISYKRFEINNRLAMFVRRDGSIAGAERESFFGSAGSSDFSGSTPPNPLHITQIALAMQMMEIPNRKKPIGGVIVFDSNNEEARRHRQEYLQEVVTTYCTSLHDLLGVVTFANPETAKLLPPDVAKIHAPRHDGDDRVWLIAEVGDTRIKIPYTGKEQQASGNPALLNFVARIRAAAPGGWPMKTTGGFVASAFESTRGIWVAVENPIESPGTIHTARTGSVSVRCRGLKPHSVAPMVVDFSGDSGTDPQALPADQVAVEGEWLTLKLAWARGDCRMYMIHHTAGV